MEFKVEVAVNGNELINDRKVCYIIIIIIVYLFLEVILDLIYSFIFLIVIFRKLY